jgi:predicted Fe-S protein YdhL (DUF1289 family)
MAATEILKPGDVPSPCINFCRLDRSNSICLGCFRNIDEIINWSKYSPAQKQQVLDQLPARKPPP